MKRFKMPEVHALQESENGSLVLYADAVEAMQSMVMFAINHADDINAGVGDFGDLKPLLDMISGHETNQPAKTNCERKTKEETGVLIMKGEQAWGVTYKEGSLEAMGWMEPIDADMHDPKYCKKPTSATYSGSSYEKQLKMGVLVNAKRVTEITLEIGDEYEPPLDMVTLKKEEG